MKFNFFLLISIFFSVFNLYGQNYWQQRADYKMSVKMDVKTFQYEGSQTINYTNNSPDTLNKVFFHLFFIFYKFITFDQDDPLLWVHNKVEGKNEYSNLLYIPSKPPFDLWNRRLPLQLTSNYRPMLDIPTPAQHLC